MVKHHVSIDLVFSALADPTRRQLMERLSRGTSRVTDLAEPFDMSLAAVSKHLRVLERAGLIRRTREGRVHHIEAEPEGLESARDWMRIYVESWERSFDALDRLLADTAPDEEKESGR